MRKRHRKQSVEDIWRTYDPIERRLSRDLSDRMLDLASLNPGMHVLDLATGRGEPAIPAARRVAPAGTVLGIDLDESMLKMARERATEESIANLQLRAGNIEALEGLPTASFHVVLCRWGLMYLTNPVAALRSARRCMTPDGLLVAAIWVEPEKASYFTMPRRVLNQFSTISPDDPDAPGTFYYANFNRLTRDLAAADFRIQHWEDLELSVVEAATGEELVEWAQCFGMSRLLESLPVEIQESWQREFLKQVEHYRAEGLYRLGGVTRIVVARPQA